MSGCLYLMLVVINFFPSLLLSLFSMLLFGHGYWIGVLGWMMGLGVFEVTFGEFSILRASVVRKIKGEAS